VNFFSKLKFPQKEIINKSDFIFLISLMIIDETDNADYFLFKFNISKKDQKRIKIIDRFYKDKNSFKKFTEKNINKIFYYDGKQAVLDILNFKIIKSKKIDEKLLELRRFYSNRSIPDMPIGAELLIKKYNIPEGRQLGIKLKKIEEAWVENNFQITDKHLQNIINN